MARKKTAKIEYVLQRRVDRNCDVVVQKNKIPCNFRITICVQHMHGIHVFFFFLHRRRCCCFSHETNISYMKWLCILDVVMHYALSAFKNFYFRLAECRTLVSVVRNIYAKPFRAA